VTARKWFGRTSILIGVLIAAIAVVASASAGKEASNPYGLMKPGTLTVGMTLQFKPQMYLNAAGKPAGYDVVLLKALAKKWGVTLNIKNLDFNGLIPGLVSKKFDMVSVGLSATPERRKSISFSRAYVPYAQILAAAKTDTTPWGHGKLHSPTIFRLRLDGPGGKLQGALLPTGFTVLVPGHKVMEQGTGIAKRDSRIASVHTSNRTQGAEVAFHFRDGIPAYRVRLRHDYIEFLIGDGEGTKAKTAKAPSAKADGNLAVHGKSHKG